MPSQYCPSRNKIRFSNCAAPANGGRDAVIQQVGDSLDECWTSSQVTHVIQVDREHGAADFLIGNFLAETESRKCA